ncbi:MAG: AAA family ATPase [Ruminococcus sp.]|nr:AAA family ATPase [Ruminococcus sp.]
MGMFLNSLAPFEAYRAAKAGTYFVDKSDLIGELIPAFGTENRFYCITRPRRFGKSVMANMIGSFLGKAADAGNLFHDSAIMQNPKCALHLNKYNVIFIDFSRMPRSSNNFALYIDRIQNGINRDLKETYPQVEIDMSGAVWDNLFNIFQYTNDKFIFIIDEWDAIFHKSFITPVEQEAYLEFLKNLLKGQVYAEFAYMTGILPIAKYSSGSELNMFLEYDIASSERFSEYFGFSDTEVDRLYAIYKQTVKNSKISREDLAFWYDGYHTAGGQEIYNPRSIVCALTDNQLRNYWTSSGPYDEIFYYIKDNVSEIRDDFILMISGERIETKMQEYAATAKELNTKEQIYSAMVIYGLLTYENGEVFIPNKELMDQFNQLLLSNESLGYVYRLARESERMLKATLAHDTDTMAEILEFVHDTESPILTYNNETELSAVVNLVYLAARDKYRVEREDKAGKGYVDFIFYPERRNADALILELKIDSTPEKAIEQIKNKNYALRFKGRMGETLKYTETILAIGISYDRKKKTHSCKIEML